MEVSGYEEVSGNGKGAIYVSYHVADCFRRTSDVIVEINDTCRYNAGESGQHEGGPLHC